MKKYILIASAALLALAACTKQVPAGQEYEIGFQVANYAATKANVAFTNTDFGVFDWHHAEDGTVTPIMVNERVGQKGTEWKTLDNTYYWPKSGSLNFIAYSPYSADKAPAVTETSIAFKAYEVGTDDLMYADRANEKTKNESTYTNISGANGVPTLFHHALAKLSFKVKVNFTEWTDPENEKDKTTWDVTLQNASLKGLYNTGDLQLALNADNATWKTEGWTPDTQKTAKELELVNAGNGMALSTTPQDLYTDKDGKAQPFFVLPQTLAKGAQQLTVKFHIKTALSNGKVLEEDYAATLDLSAISSLTAWGMNQNIIYTICIKPTASVDPNNPDDPTDVIITFDPAQMDWETVDAQATIQI